MRPDVLNPMSIARTRIAEEAERRTGSLDLRELGLETLPDELFDLHHLRELDLGISDAWRPDAPRNSLDAQRERLGTLTLLERLSVVGSDLSNLDFAQGLPALTRLDCSDTPLADLAPLAGLTALADLDCSSTRVADLAPLAGLTALATLDCSYTPLAGLEGLEGLPALATLVCSRCRLHDLPASVRDKPRLRRLVLNGSHVEGLPGEVLSSSSSDGCLRAVRAHFADLAAEEAVLTDVRLLLLGNGRVGKTQIARWLVGEPFEEAWDSTHGIQIAGRPLGGVAEARLVVWDFGGQDIYHGTHALFLRGPAVVAVVWATEQEERDTYEHGGLTFRNHPLAYWAETVRHLADPDCPVLILQNKCDRPEQEVLSFPIAEDTLKALRYRKQLHVSAKEPRRGEAALQEALRDAVGWLREPSRLGLPRIGAGRLRVQRRLEALRNIGERLLEQEAYETICAEEGGVSSPAHLLAYLDANGTVLHRPGLFGGRIILDQGWALEAVYAVFDRARIYKVLSRAGGRFTRPLLGLLVWREHGEKEQELLLGMMRSCGICFLHRHRRRGGEDNEYVAPDLLPERTEVEDALAGRWDEDRDGEAAVFRYPLLHGGLIRTVMAEIGEEARSDALYWRGGLYAFETTTRSRLLIEEAMTGPGWAGEIRVRTQGGRAAELLGRLVEVIKRAQERLGMRSEAVERSSARVEVPKEVPMAFAQEKPAESEWYVSYAWGDGTPEGRERERVVDDLCARAAAEGRVILRDKEVLKLGDSISAFMRRIGAGDRVFVILSDKYLRSPHCMFELCEVWRRSRQETATFLDRVRVYTLGDADIWEPVTRARYAIHWKRKHDELEAIVRENGPVLGERDFAAFRRMADFRHHVGDILATFADIVQPRSLDELTRCGFEGRAER